MSNRLPGYKKTGFLYELKKNRILFLMVLPVVLYVFVFCYLPMGGAVLAFKNYNYRDGVFGSPWCGFENFKFFFSSGEALTVTLNTVGYNLLFLMCDVLFQITIALFLSEIFGRKFKKISQTLLLMPYFVSWVVVASILLGLVGYENGLLNSILTAQGLERVNVMNTPKYWPFLFVLFHIWKNLGYGSVVYLSAITGINRELYEAAAIDGANVFQRIWKITLPSLRPTVVILILLQLGNIVRGDFGMFWNMTGNNPLLYDVSNIVDTFVYRSMIGNSDFGMSAAAGLYQSVLGFFMILGANTLIKKLQPDYTLF